MPVPTTVADLDPVAANNYPIGSENVGPNLDNYLRAHASIIRQVSDGIAPAIAATVPAGVILMWSGSAASIPAGWKLCDGTNGTPNLVNRFVLGANATSPAVGATGGAVTVTLNVNQIPVHGHAIADSGHSHGVIDSGHVHGLIDPGHSHGITVASPGGSAPSQVSAAFTTGAYGNLPTNSAGTGLGLSPANANISLATSGTGIVVQNTGSGQSHENMPPYYALCFIQKS